MIKNKFKEAVRPLQIFWFKAFTNTRFNASTKISFKAFTTKKVHVLAFIYLLFIEAIWKKKRIKFKAMTKIDLRPLQKFKASTKNSIKASTKISLRPSQSRMYMHWHWYTFYWWYLRQIKIQNYCNYIQYNYVFLAYKQKNKANI